MDLKKAGDFIFLIGETKDELAGSHLALVQGENRPSSPPSLPQHALEHYRALHQAMRLGLVKACHDLSEGGLGVAAAEMCIGGRRGMTISLGDDDGVVSLYSESNGRLLVEVAPAQAAAFRQVMVGCPLAEMGVVAGDRLVVSGRANEVLFGITVADLVTAWQGGAA